MPLFWGWYTMGYPVCKGAYCRRGGTGESGNHTNLSSVLYNPSKEWSGHTEWSREIESKRGKALALEDGAKQDPKWPLFWGQLTRRSASAYPAPSLGNPTPLQLPPTQPACSPSVWSLGVLISLAWELGLVKFPLVGVDGFWAEISEEGAFPGEGHAELAEMARDGTRGVVMSVGVDMCYAC